MFFLLLFAKASFASEQALQENRKIINIDTATHLGYAVEKASTTGFDNVGGSICLLDIIFPYSEDVAVGMRTAAVGGQKDSGRFYRLGSGPFVSYQVMKHWFIEAGLSYFSETGTTPDGLREYRSRGQSIMISWQRLFPITNRVAAGWGGFVSRYSGSVEAMNSLPIPQQSHYAKVENNVGGSQGVAGTLRIDL